LSFSQKTPKKDLIFAFFQARRVSKKKEKRTTKSIFFAQIVNKRLHFVRTHYKANACELHDVFCKRRQPKVPADKQNRPKKRSQCVISDGFIQSALCTALPYPTDTKQGDFI
jgi:hypothetical protein